ncbi:apolipoprotein N-acyltransferase [Colwellia asteriadis]|uniref:Apolipoprotein N-acyltransferase n=1 Tax=Colwellia asteriadis TaxID=517723 RepID=A0ABP3WH30_9GAMM
MSHTDKPTAITSLSNSHIVEDKTSEQLSANTSKNNISPSKQRKDLLLVLLTVALFYLAFPSGGYGHLAWFIMIPLMIALHNTQGKYAFMLGLVAATLGWMCSIWLVVDGLAQVTFSQSNIVIPFIFGFCVLFALPYALACWLHARFYWGNSISGALKSALTFTVIVNYIPNVLPGNLAHALYLAPLHIQLLDIGGVPLVFFLLHFVNFLLATAVIHWRKRIDLSVKCIAVALSCWLINVGYGYVKINDLLEPSTEKIPTLSIAMVQPNVDISLRTRDDWRQTLPKIQELLAGVVSAEPTDLIILPEMPVPLSYKNYPQDKHAFDAVIKNNNLLITAIELMFNPINNEVQGYFNTVELISEQALLQQYKKQKLLPIGEYLPFEAQLPILRTLFPNAPNYIAGKQTYTLTLALEQKTINIVPLICYEAVFTELVANSLKKNALNKETLEPNNTAAPPNFTILVNTVNDAWFGNTAGRDVHLALALYRSVEYRKPLVRVTNNGVSGIINHKGEIIKDSQIKSFTADSVITHVDLVDIHSIYQRFPYGFMLLAIIFVVVVIISEQYKRAI